MRRTLFLFVIAIGLFESLPAQVSNNNIQNRIGLTLNGNRVFSSTAKSNVEWKCINKALTNKCLVYHNDQWFDFSVPVAGTYFINLSAQKCRDTRGLQLIVIEGNPCETKTYRILQCIPQIRQDDVFVQLDSLRPNTQYLVNMDGFLGDYCEFAIQIAEKPGGLPRTYQTPDTIKARVSSQGRLVNLHWTVAEERIAQFQSFKIYRTTPASITSDLILEQPVSRNTYGTHILEYETTDSLQKAGTYSYRIFGLQKETQLPALLVTRAITYHEPKPKPLLQKSIDLDLNFRDKAVLKILIYNELNHTLLRKETKIFESAPDHPFTIDLSEAIDKGERQFLILISDEEAQAPLEFYYFFNGERLIRH